MSKLVQRLLLFFIGIPLILCIVYVDFAHHLLMAIAICIFTTMAASELHALFSATAKLLPRVLIISLSTSIPVVAYIANVFGLPYSYATWMLALGVVILFAYPSLKLKKFEGANEMITMSVFVLCYAGYPLTFLMRLSENANAVYYIAFFLCMVFFCDSVAWLFGMTMGKGNRGVVAASPNKSVAGFIGGYAGSIAIAVVATIFFPDVFPEMWQAVVIAVVTASAAIIGDLTESVFKRASNIKDSGNLMPGRGGVLDSIDSVLVASPVFYIALHLIYKV